MLFDWDDFHEGNHRLDLFERLKGANPAFRCTVFAVPGLGSDSFWDSVPDYIELAVHGHTHPHPREAENWSFARTVDVLLNAHVRFTDGYKAPGWQISSASYLALMSLGWWCADHYDNDARRPEGLRTHRLSRTASTGQDPAHWHGHVQPVCGNGMQETWDRLLPLVAETESFELVSEMAAPWKLPVPA